MTDTKNWQGDDQPIDERIRALAAGYHQREGTVPRDEMWAAIRPAWRAAQTTPAVVAFSGRSHARWRWTAALAAGLLLGIAIDRGVVSYRARAHVASTPVTRDSARVAQAPAVDSPTPVVAASPVHGSPHTGGERTAVMPPRIAERAPGREPARANDGRAPARASVDVATQRLYHAAAQQTLVQAEALLTAYRSSEAATANAESMRVAARWARDVLSSTRLLLDSPAARDPQLRALLTDLELVLAQIVQRAGAPLEAGERDLIERAMRDRDLLPRLRSAVPAGAAASD